PVRSESGTGKALIARAIHEVSARRNGPLIGCAMLQGFHLDFLGRREACSKPWRAVTASWKKRSPTARTLAVTSSGRAAAAVSPVTVRKACSAPNNQFRLRLFRKPDL